MKTEDKVLRFKTNIKCGGCIETVTPFLNATQGIGQWEVDTADKDKILTVHAEGATQSEIMKKVHEAGFKIEPVE